MAEPYSSRLEALVEAKWIDCSLCYEKTSFVSVGSCGHAEVCWLCALRLRWLCKDNACAICKEELHSVTVRHISLRDSETKFEISDVLFDSFKVYSESLRLMSQYACPYACGEREEFRFRSLQDLRTHLKRDHGGAMYCGVCLDNRKAFLPEQEIFDSQGDLQLHSRKEHPSCEFCPKEFSKHYSMDELLVHLNQAHFKCFVCERLDYRNEYYCNFEALDTHFDQSHFRCEYPECREERFVVFPEEEDLRLHRLEKHGAAVISIGRQRSSATCKKPRNMAMQQYSGFSSSVIHFRGPRNYRFTNTGVDHVVRTYPDVESGRSYDKRVHSVLPAPPETRINPVSVSFSFKLIEARLKDAKFVNSSDKSYQSENIEFLKRLSSLLDPETLAAIKSLSKEYLNGEISEEIFLDRFKRIFFAEKKNLIDILVDLIRLMPDHAHKRSSLLAYIASQGTGAKRDKRMPPHIEMPTNLFESVSTRKPCLINALLAILDAAGEIKSPPLSQSIVSAMENKIHSCDRIQLTTLSEMRSHLLILAEGNVNHVSWKAADSILSLRPLLYRLTQIPETHKAREKQLIASGWSSFCESATSVLAQFNEIELAWLKAYITFASLRISTIGNSTFSKRLDFPTLPSSAYFPSITVPTTPAPSIPSRSDFPVGLVNTAPLQTRAAPRQWQSSGDTLRDELAFPQLVQVQVQTLPSTSSSSQGNRPWSCSRCTFLNIRLLSSSCEICGMDRPPPGHETTSSQSEPAPATGPDRPRRAKQRVVLSSATQRDYKR